MDCGTRVGARTISTGAVQLRGFKSPAACGRAVGAISVQNLTVRFDSTTALDNVTASVPAGVLTMIVGPPGSGKTVLMKSLACELPWGSGTVWIQDVPARLWPAKKRDACMCTCPARRGLACPVADPAACSLVRNYGTDGPVNVTFRFREALRLLGVEHLEKRCGPSLADRDRRRLELAFTLAPFLSGSDTRCVHLWLDDPLDGIDNLHQHRLLQWLRETARTRHTTVITATDHGIVRVYADHSILLTEGSLIAEGPPQRALRPDHLTRAFGHLLQESPDY